MPLARHDGTAPRSKDYLMDVSTHMPLARHDLTGKESDNLTEVSTHMPLARHDVASAASIALASSFYSHASCEA